MKRNVMFADCRVTTVPLTAHSNAPLLNLQLQHYILLFLLWFIVLMKAHH